MLPRDASLCVYRVAQEALQNFIKHAGVNEAEVILKQDNGAIGLVVSDRGAGMLTGASSEGLGLVSMKERTRLVHGAMTIQSRPGEGVTVRLEVPIPAPQSVKA